MSEIDSPFLNLAFKRQSVRKYRSEAVSREAVIRCLEAARVAPSANNGQPWHFTVSPGGDSREALAVAARFGLVGGNKFASQAPVIIVVSETPGHRATKWGGKAIGRNFPQMDLGMAVQNFCLQASEEGLGTCILGLFDAKLVRKAVDLPQAYKPQLLITLGHPESTEIRKKVRKPLDEISRILSGNGIINAG